MSFSQWSEVHDIARPKMTQSANIVLLPARFQITGPDELIAVTQATSETMRDEDPEDAKWAIYQVWSQWHVICAVSGQKILLCDLRYWDTNGLIYASPDLISVDRAIPVT